MSLWRDIGRGRGCEGICLGKAIRYGFEAGILPGVDENSNATMCETFCLSRDVSNAKNSPTLLCASYPNRQPRQLGSHTSSAKDLEKVGGFLVYRFNRAINGIAIAVAAVCAKYTPVDPVSVVTIGERLLPVQELQKHGRFMVQLMNRPKLLSWLDSRISATFK